MSKKAIDNLLKFVPKPVKDYYLMSQIDLSRPIDSKIIFKIADTKEELYQAYVLLHDRYVDSGLQLPLLSRMRITPYHLLPETKTIVAVKNKKVLATLTIIPDSFFGLPCESTFDLSKIKTSSKKAAEISALAVCNDYKGQLFLPLLKFTFNLARDFLGVGQFVASVKEGLAADVYDSYFAFKKVEEEGKEYAFGNNQRIVAMYLDFEVGIQDCERKYQGKDKSKNVINYLLNEKVSNFDFSLKNMNMHFDLFKYFFIDKSNVLFELEIKKLNHLLEVYQGLPHEHYILKALELKQLEGSVIKNVA